MKEKPTSHQCGICGHPWQAPAGTWGSGSLPQCPTCVYLEMAHRHAQAQGISLRRAVNRYLQGKAKRLDPDERPAFIARLWKGKG